MLPHSNLNPTSHCNASVPEFSVNPLVGGSVCNNSVNFLRMAWNEAEPLVLYKNKCDVIIDMHH